LIQQRVSAPSLQWQRVYTRFRTLHRWSSFHLYWSAFAKPKNIHWFFHSPTPRGTSLKRRLSVYAREGADTIAYPPITNIITTFSVFFTGCRMLNKVPVAADAAVLLDHGFIAALFFVCAEQCGI
jgi:hypothetical protein